MNYSLSSKVLNATVIIASLGYFIDMYDLLIFNVVRVSSLSDLGLQGDEITSVGVTILNLQVVGLLLGSFFWGILSDRFGRKSCLLASVLAYSAVSLLCAFVQDVDVYKWLRFAAGFVLAGEIGIGITLISEIMTSKSRGKAVALFSALGFAGILSASLITEFVNWRAAYIFGGVAGLLLLVARSMMLESGMFKSLSSKTSTQGDFKIILKSPVLICRYLCAILVAAPVYFCVLLYTFSPEIGKTMGIETPLRAPVAIMFFEICLITGSFLAAFFSDYIKSRKVPILSLNIFGLLVLVGFCFMPKSEPIHYYMFNGFFGFSVGYLALAYIIGAEQFGINIRGTASTTIANFVRALIVPFMFFYREFRDFDILWVIGIMGAVVFIISSLSLLGLEETYDKDLDYNDT